MVDAGKRVVYTVGHSNRSFDYFLRLILKHGIEVLVDVRRFPTSKTEHFRSGRLRSLLKEHGIEYVHMEELGGFREGGYERYMEDERWKNAYKTLVELCERKRCALMCRESNPKYCHRRYISERMVSEGWKVYHIIDIKRCLEHREVFSSQEGVQRGLDDYL